MMTVDVPGIITGYTFEIPLTFQSDSASKNEKAVTGGNCGGPARPRLRSSSDGSIYTRRVVGGHNTSYSMLSNPKSGKAKKTHWLYKQEKLVKKLLLSSFQWSFSSFLG